MLKDKLNNNELFLLKQSLRNAANCSYQVLIQSLKEFNSFYNVSAEETELLLKTEIKDVYDYLKGKGLYGYKTEIECPACKKNNLNKIEENSTINLEELIDLIISCGSVPSEGNEYFSKSEIIEIEKYARNHSDKKLEKKIRKILKDNLDKK